MIWLALALLLPPASAGRPKRTDPQACEREAQAEVDAIREQAIAQAAAPQRGRLSRVWAGVQGCLDGNPHPSTVCREPIASYVADARSVELVVPETALRIGTACGEVEVAVPASTSRLDPSVWAEAERLLRHLGRTRPLAWADIQEQPSAEYARLAQQKRLQSIRLLEELLSKGGVDGPRAAEMFLRLADLHVQAGAHLKSQGDGAADEHLQTAVALYQRILSDHPTYARLDQATFFLGEAQRHRGHPDEALQAWVQVVKRFPESEFAPRAYRLIGDAYADDNAYKAILAYGKAVNAGAVGVEALYARYRLAWAYADVDELDKARDLLTEVAADGMDRDDARRIVEAAEVDLGRW